MVVVPLLMKVLLPVRKDAPAETSMVPPERRVIVLGVAPPSCMPAGLSIRNVEPVKMVAFAPNVNVCRIDGCPMISVFVPLLSKMGCVALVLVEVILPFTVTVPMGAIVPSKPPPVLEVGKGEMLMVPVMVTLAI